MITTYEKKRIEKLYEESVKLNDSRDNMLLDIEHEINMILDLDDHNDWVFDMIYNNEYDVDDILRELEIGIEYDGI